MKIISLINSDLLIEVDDEYWLEFVLQNWRVSGFGYAVTKRADYLHILIANKLGLKGKIDHKDRNKLNNQRNNLREANQSLNAANSIKRENCSSIYKGVCWSNNANKYLAYIDKDKRRIHLGYYEYEEAAAKAYDEAAMKYFGAFACLNFS